MAKPMGKKLKDAEMKMRVERKLVFKGKEYDLTSMTPQELEELHNALRLDSRQMRRPNPGVMPDENNRRGYISRLRMTQAKIVRRESRVKESE